MEKKQVIQYYVKPDGTKVVRAFCLKDFVWCDENGMIISLSDVLANTGLTAQVGCHSEIQKNRMNTQLVSQKYDIVFPHLVYSGSIH